MFYVAVILGLYIFGLILLFLHWVWNKHGRITFYDIYFEIMPLSTEAQGSPEEIEIVASNEARPHTRPSGKIIDRVS